METQYIHHRDVLPDASETDGSKENSLYSPIILPESIGPIILPERTGRVHEGDYGLKGLLYFL